MTAISINSVEQAEHGIARDATARDMTQGGLALSAALHLGMLILVIFGLPSLFHRPPPQESPIAVDLVMIAPETKATHPNPYRPKPEAKPEPPVAAPAPKPEPKPEPPAPAPEPAAAAPPPPPPEIKPEVKPEVKAPPAPPPPKPVEAQSAPPPPLPRPPEPKPKQVHQQVPAPKADPAAFDKLLKNLEQKRPAPAVDKVARNLDQRRPEPAAFDSLLQNLTREQTAEDEEAPPAPHRVAATAPPSSQPKAPLGSQLSASDIDLVRERLRPCFNPPFGAKENPDLVADIRVVMNPDGTVQQAHVVDMGRYGSDQVYRALADSGVRALKNPQCSPLPLPADRFDAWRSFILGVSTKDMQ